VPIKRYTYSFEAHHLSLGGFLFVMSYELAQAPKASFANIRSSRTFVISTVAVAVFVDLFLYSLIIPILPTLLTDRANVSASKLQITLSGLLATFHASVVICAPITGYFADRWSNRKYFLLGGLCALAATTVLFMVSRNLGLLFFARMLQGASASIVWAVGLALLVDVIGPKDIGVAMGWVSLGLSLGNTLGPVLGGIVYNRAGQYAAFTMGFATIAVDFVMRCLLRETNRSQVGSVLEEAQVQQESSHGSTESGASGEKPNEAAEVTIQINDPQPSLEHQQANQCRPGLFSIFTLLKYPDMLSSLWSVFLMTVILTGLEAVSNSKENILIRLGP
jgi:MFS family permease